MKFKDFAKDDRFQCTPSSLEYPNQMNWQRRQYKKQKTIYKKQKRIMKIHMLQARNIPVDNYKSPVELACVRKL